MRSRRIFSLTRVVSTSREERGEDDAPDHPYEARDDEQCDILRRVSSLQVRKAQLSRQFPQHRDHRCVRREGGRFEKEEHGREAGHELTESQRSSTRWMNRRHFPAPAPQSG